MTVVGLDLSLTSTGVAIIDSDGDVYTHRCKSKPAKGVAATATRIDNLAHEILGWATDGYTLPSFIKLAVIESPSFGSSGGAAHERAGLWWQVATVLTQLGIPIGTVSPAGLKVYATGKGRGVEKDEVLASVVKRYPQANIIGNDVADATVLAAMGKRWLGNPIEEALPATHTRAMDGAAWPS